MSPLCQTDFVTAKSSRGRTHRLVTLPILPNQLEDEISSRHASHNGVQPGTAFEAGSKLDPTCF